MENLLIENQLESALLAFVLKEMVDEIIITNKGRRISLKGAALRKSIDVQSQAELDESIQNQLDPFRESLKVLDDVKLQEDINWLIESFYRVIEELVLECTFEHLTNLILEQRQQLNNEIELIKNYENSKIVAERLNKELSNKTSNIELQLCTADDNINSLQHNLDTCNRISTMEVNLVSKWEHSRYIQACTLYKIEEKRLTETIRLYKYKIKSEKIIIGNIEHYNSIEVENLEILIEYWKKRYEQEINELNKKISLKNKKIIEIKNSHENYQTIYEERQNIINEYCERKAKEQALYEIELKRITSAIKIQAWWRGTMVRRNLGPYKKKKKGKKSKKSK